MSTLPIIVGGCHRSGTSLVRRVLDAHSRIHCGPEVKFFLDFYGGYRQDPLRHLRFATTARSLLPEDELLELLGSGFVELHERAATRAGKPRWADKNPENVLQLASWRRLLGDRWVFVHVVRNPLDTLASMTEHGFPLTLPEGLDARIDTYLACLEAGLEFGAAHPERCFRFVYEELVTDSTSTLRSLMTWLGEELEPGQMTMDDARHQSGLEDPKISQTSEIHRDSLGRWRELLTEDEIARIRNRTAGVWSTIDPDGRWTASDSPALPRS